jgi:crotonobetaine/carnitine-CoA ligase
MGDGTVGGRLGQLALEQPGRPAVSCAGRSWTYAELDDRTSAVAAGFARLGLSRGDRVAILTVNRPEVIELYYGLAKIGVIQVPLNPYLRGEFLRYQLADADPHAFVVDREGLASSAAMLADLPSLRALVRLDPLGPGEQPGDHGLLEIRGYEAVTAAEAEVPVVDLRADDIMSILYTSGTTGLPKGCLLPHGYYLRVGREMCKANSIVESDVLFTALPLFHSAGRMMVVAAALVGGASVVVEPSFSARNFFRRATEVGATLAYGVGAAAVALLKSEPSGYDRRHHVRSLLCPPMLINAQEEFQKRFGFMPWAESYGQTECVPVLNNPIDGVRRPGCMGRPVSDLEVVLLNEDDDPVPQGTAGEICLRPVSKHSMFAGYWHKPEATVAATTHLWYHTGDTAYVDADGYFWFLDRKKDAIRRRGENVSSVELEAAIGSHEKIADVAVHGVPSDSSEEDIKVVIVLSEDTEASPEELYAFFAANLPYYAVPRYVEIVDALPRNSIGRVLKYRLRERPMTEAIWDLQAAGLVPGRSERR